MDLSLDKIDQLLQARSEIDEELRRHKSKVTVFFTDVVGSTTYFDRFGDTAGLLLLHRHDHLVTTAVEEFRGFVVKTIGDSVMAEFPDPDFAVRAAITIQRRLFEHNLNAVEEERLRIRTGIHYGVGFRRGNDLFGDAINLAARITKRGGPGQILVSQAARDALAENEFYCRSLGKVSLEGKAESEELYEVIWTDAKSYEHFRSSIRSDSVQSDLGDQGEELDSFIQKTPTPSEIQAALLPGATPTVQSTALHLQRYEILARLGVGGMGLVYKARDRETGETVALKVLKAEIAEQPALIDAFKNELRLARKITHKNVCRIYDFNRTDGVSFISMEFIEGESLRRVLNRFSALSTRTGIKIATQICEGLREAHAQGIVHRDLKPENLMIDTSGNVKLMDFGLAHLVAEVSTAAVGTPSYMAPEQAQGEQVDLRCDIYSLGLVLFEMFTGSAAFTGETPIAVALKQIQDAPKNPRDLDRSIPDHIAKAILRCLEKDPAKRFQTVEELQAAILTESSSQKVASKLQNDAPRTAVAVTAAVVFILIVAFFIFGRTGTTRQDAPLAPSDAEFAAFHLAESVDTQGAWNAFLENYGKGELASAARERVKKLEAQEESLKNSTNPKVVASNVPAASKSADVVPRLKSSALVETISIPGGVFMMGNDAGRGDEKPRHQVRLDGFRMSRSEVTNREYLPFLEDTGYPRPRDPAFAKNYLMAHPNLPVVNVNYNDAVAFCKWAGKKLGVTVRLPTEAEWEYAARGRGPDSLFPWGTADAKSRARFKDNTPRDMPTVPRDTFPPNDYGLYNMQGNVSEWVSDFYSKDYYNVSPVKNPSGPAAGTKRVVRGGSWADYETQLANPRRASRDPNEHSDQVGFRIVVEGK
jgi:formylglycine-generating enzyme required for sulfatase activity/class 3 adenylate cyclase/predicted Ser/Thr protein kinase